MKKAIILILSLIILICGSAVTGCTKASTAVGRFDLIRENFAREKEAEDDENGREHIEIPADAETIEIENETWTVVREAKKFQKATGNYILANDMVLSDLICFANDFEGKLNGNNYKIKNYNVGTIKRLFYSIENSTIENIIFTTIDGYGGYNNTNSEPLIATFAKNCVIKNCVSYYQQDANYYKKANKKNYTRYNGFVANVHDSIIEDCINYGDFYVGYGGIVTYAINSTIRNCKNYGNISGGGGGIVSAISGDTIIENCENYGAIVSGVCGTGGIVGRPGEAHFSLAQNGNLDNKDYTENQIVRNCKNYGDIYLLKEEGAKRIESTDHDVYSETNDNYLDYMGIIYEFGGVAGSISRVENCENYGNFYGFENMGDGIKVRFLGGVVGAAKHVINCENSGVVNVQKGRGIDVGDIYGFLDN